MAISGIGSYNYQYASSLNQMRWLEYSKNSASAAEEAKKKLESGSSSSSTSSVKSSYSSTESFLRDYQSELTALESAASKLIYGNSKNVFTDFKAASTNEDVATVKGNWRLNGNTDITLNVTSLAQAQKNESAAHYSQEKVEAGADMEFKITGASGMSAEISISSTNKDGSARTYNDMYQDAAKAINANSHLGVRATVSNVEGKVSLVLTAKDTGESKGFTVEGKTGAAAGIENASVAAQDAVYSVTENGYTQEYRSSTNDITLDYGRIDAKLKATGETNVYTGVDEDDVVAAVKDLVDKYNSVTSMLSANAGRGSGAASHLASFQRGMADKKTLAAIGINFDEYGKMHVDEDKLKESLENDYNWTRDMIGGQFGIAQKAATRADSALSDSVQSIVDKDLSNGQGSGSDSDSVTSAVTKGIGSSSFQYFSSFARGGAFNLSNYYAVGMLLNTLA